MRSDERSVISPSMFELSAASGSQDARLGERALQLLIDGLGSRSIARGELWNMNARVLNGRSVALTDAGRLV